MNKLLNKFRHYIMLLSFQERERKEQIKTDKRVKKYMDMKELELKMEYVKIKSMYEHQKNILGLFLIAIILAILSESWKLFFNFMQSAISYSSLSFDNSVEYAIVGFFIAVISITFITTIIFICLIKHIKKLNVLYRETLLIEMIIEEKGIVKNGH